MLTFTKFLIEQILIAEKRASKAATAEVSSDDKGKLHELLLAKHLIKHQDPNGEGFLPQHFRAGKDHPNKKIKGKSPQEVHDDIRSRIGEAAYNEINGHAAQTAESIVQHAIRTGRIKSRKDITNVHWTSNRDTFKKAGDHENLTGQKGSYESNQLFNYEDCVPNQTNRSSCLRQSCRCVNVQRLELASYKS